MNCTYPPCPLASDMAGAMATSSFWRRVAMRYRNVVATALLAWSIVAMPAHAQCSSPVPGGDPNGSSCPGIASAPAGGADAGGGNPINVMTGNKYQRENDLPALPGVLGLEIIRHYNSAYSSPAHPNGVLGRGWRLSYETELVDRFGKLQVLQADGGRVIFDRNRNAPTGCSTSDPANGSMTLGHQQDGRSDYTWTWTDGRKLHFNAAGKLDRITAPTGETLRLLYDSQNVLVRVIDPQGRSLNLVYFERNDPNQFHGIRFIDTPVGRFAYEYGSTAPKGAGLIDKRQLLANLVRVRLPDQFEPEQKAHALSSRGTTRSTTSRFYHHEDPRSPWLMTGISIEALGADGKPVTTRYSTYGYDGTGRAVLSTHANNVNKVTLDNSMAGRTVLTNSLGTKTVYRYTVIAGKNRLIEVRGAGCALCNESNVRYTYNSVGQQIETTRLAEGGGPVATIRTERDKLGRIIRISKIAYQQGNPRPAQLQARFEYKNSSYVPYLVARPSVVPGAEFVTHIDYNSVGQPLRVTDNGWAPAHDNNKAKKIERTTIYSYITFNGRSVLAKIDGPLPNGKMDSPLDSDITIIEYGQNSKLVTPLKLPLQRFRLEEYASSNQHENIATAVIAPGNRRSEVEYDYAGRIVSIKNSEGFKTILSYSSRGQVLAVKNDGVIYNIRYDSYNNAVEFGSSDDLHYWKKSRLGYDDAGRNIWTASALGIVDTMRFDTEGHLLEKATVSTTIKQTHHYGYDFLGRMLSMTDASGSTRRINWNKQSKPNLLSDAFGRDTHVDYDLMGNITSVKEPDGATTRFEVDLWDRPTAIVAPNGATTRYIRDDFGQILVIIGANSGTTTQSFDAAGRVTESTDAKGNRTIYEYDLLGHVVMRSVTDVHNSGKQTVTKWGYEGAHLVRIDHPDQAERYSYDSKGRVNSRTVVLTLAGNARYTNTTYYSYDAAGHLDAVSLPDGSMLDYRRNGQNQVIALERRWPRDQWLRSLLPHQTIVKNLERDIVGIKRFSYGNGIEAHYQRSKQGSLARIVYRDPRRPLQVKQLNSTPGNFLNNGRTLAIPVSVNASAYRVLPLLSALELPSDSQALLDHRYIWDSQGNLLYTREKNSVNTFVYDKRDRLIATASADVSPALQAKEITSNTSFARFYYDSNGNQLLAQEGLADQGNFTNNTLKTKYAPGLDRWQKIFEGEDVVKTTYDAAGQTELIGKRRFLWDASGKLIEVRDGQQIVARYRYNHRGERIEKIANGTHTYYLYENRQLVAELDDEGILRRQYIYMADQPVAIIDKRPINAASSTENKGIARFSNDIATVWHARRPTIDTITYLQTNHLGSIEMATDARGKPIWNVVYSPYGKIMHKRLNHKTTEILSSFELNLRLPGQYADQETGLYYNDHRYYDPEMGRYLTPDPLGPQGGSNSYTYVDGNPLRYIDPTGLILFAFDGTNNSNPPPGVDDFSNVYKFFLAYDAVQNGPKWYMNGIGRDDQDSGIKTNITDAADANTGIARVQFMTGMLDDYVSNTSFQKGEMVNIDIVGFSRGAAMARDFANRVAVRLREEKYKESGACLQIRFLGLWDTVAQFGLNGIDNKRWQLEIPIEAKNVFHAVALNEHRYAFPGESIGRGTQKGFIGSHADIGGSYGTGDLSDIALNWIVEKAKDSGIKLFDWGKNGTDIQWEIVTNPVLHDKGGNDRDFCLRTNNEMWVKNCKKQKQATPGGMTWSETQAGNFISLYPNAKIDADGSSKIIGTVNMEEYSAWLKQNYGLNVQFSSP